MAIFFFLPFKVSGNLGASNLNQVTFRQITFYMVPFELPDYFCVVRLLKIYRIHGQLQRRLGNTVLIQSALCLEKKIRGSNTM